MHFEPGLEGLEELRARIEALVREPLIGDCSCADEVKKQIYIEGGSLQIWEDGTTEM